MLLLTLLADRGEMTGNTVKESGNDINQISLAGCEPVVLQLIVSDF